jgi:hypothetical protein
MRHVETIPGMGGAEEGVKGEWWKRWIQLWYIVRTFVNVTIYPQYYNNIVISKKRSIERKQENHNEHKHDKKSLQWKTCKEVPHIGYWLS